MKDPPPLEKCGLVLGKIETAHKIDDLIGFRREINLKINILET